MCKDTVPAPGAQDTHACTYPCQCPPLCSTGRSVLSMHSTVVVVARISAGTGANVRQPVCAAVCARASLHKRGLLRTLGALAGSVRWMQVPHELQQDALPLYSAACIRVPEDGACGKCGQGYSCSGKPSRAAWYRGYPSGTDRRRDELSGFRPFRSEWRHFFPGRSCHPVGLFLHAQEMTPVLCVDGQLIRGSYAIVKFLATEMCARNRTCRETSESSVVAALFERSRR